MTRRSPWPVRGTILAGLMFLMVALVGAGVWMGRVQLAGAIIAPGRIQVAGTPHKVEHPEGGRLLSLLVDEGDTVAAGAIVGRLDSSELSSSLSRLDHERFEVLARKTRLEAERDGLPELRFASSFHQTQGAEIRDIMAGQTRLFQARLNALSDAVDQRIHHRDHIGQMLRALEQQREALQARQTLIDDQITLQSDLHQRGLTSATTLDDLRHRRYQLQADLGALAAQSAEAEGQIAQIELDLLGLHTKRREAAITELRDLRLRELDLQERRHSLQSKLDKMTLRAPVAGRVHDLRTNGVGGVLKPAVALMSIVPNDHPLVVAARIPVSAIKNIHPDQRVRLRIVGGARTDAPDLPGRVRTISADTFADGTTGAQFYRAEITLDDDGALNSRTLISGMPVEVFFRTEDRTMLAYLLDPLGRYFDRAFRD